MSLKTFEMISKSAFLILVLAVFRAHCEVEDHMSVQRIPEDGKVIIKKSEDKDTKATMLCESPNGDEANFRWFRVVDGDEIELTNIVGGDVNVAGGELSVNVGYVNHRDVFRCKLDEKRSADFEIVDSDAPTEPVVPALLFRIDRFLRSYSVVENEDLKMNCYVVNRTADGFDINEIAIKWFMWDVVDDLSFEATVGNCSADSMIGAKWTEIIELSDNEEPHIKFLSRDGISKAVLKIEDAEKSDRRGFKCVAFNLTDPDSCSEGVGFVRVKDKYAALWPFLGIVAEVVVLLTIILIAEKRRANKEALEEEDDDDIPVPNPHDHKNTVRQRRQ